jgi:S1-C subfamily serine protease
MLGSMSNALSNLSEQLIAAVAQAAGSVVTVEGSRRLPVSGVLWRDGIIVTVDHGIKREEGLSVSLPDGKSVSASLVGRDPGTDLAVLKAETGPVKPGWPGSDAHPGTIVLAVGRSAEVGVHTAMGVISAVHGAWRTWRGGRIDRYIRLDLTMYPGLSGAVVVDAGGRMVGIATSALSRIAGVGIPAETVDRVVEEVLKKGYVSRAYLGVGVQPVGLADGNGGLMVVSLEPQAPAAAAGLLLGDILLAVAGKQVRAIDDLQDVLQSRKVGDRLPLRLSRAGVERDLEVTLGERARKAE